MKKEQAGAEEFIRQHTEVITNPFIPELKLHMITENCPMWRMNELDVTEMGIEEPFWGFSWPGGDALAKFVLEHPELVENKTVLDFGTGAGIVAIAACLAGASRVTASDTDPMALQATLLNARLNGVKIETSRKNFIGATTSQWDVILAADVCYEAEMTKDVTAWLSEMSAQGSRVFLADPKRGWLQEYAVEEIAHYETSCDVDCRGVYLQDTFIYSWSL